MNFKNMKIPVENNLDEIVAELERMGYRCFAKDKQCQRFVVTNSFGWYDIARYDEKQPLTTLAELKEM